MLVSLIEQIHAAQPVDFWLWAVIIGVISLAGFWLWFRSIKRARLIEDTPTSKCRSAAQGYVELIGAQKLMPGEPVMAPLTGRSCTWWEYKVEEKRTTYSRGRSQTKWVTVDSDTSEELFLIEDETGKAVIDPEGAEVTPSTTDVWYGSSRHPKAPPLGGSGGLLFGGRYRYTEKRMHDGEPLYAIGFFETRSNHHEPLQKAQETAAVLAAWKKDQAGLLRRFDKNGDGSIDMTEWEAARNAAEALVAAKAREAALDPGINLMMRPPDGKPFLLSVLPETELTKRFRYFAIAGLAMFFGAGAAAAFMITTRLASG